MRRSLVPLAVCLLAAAAASPALCGPTAVAGGTSMPVRDHGVFLLSEVYQTIPGNYGPCNDGSADPPAGNPDNICPNRCFNGATGQDPDFDAVSVIPGILCLDTNSDCTLNTNAFAICDASKGEFQPFVQSFRLIKRVEGSHKAPMCYGDPDATDPAMKPAVYYQFGSKGVRTWWTLKYTSPGTTFCLELTVRCLQPIPGAPGRTRPVLHIDRWCWKVVVSPDILPLVIQMLASSPLSVLEFPCIADERVLMELVARSVILQQAVNEGADISDQQAAFFDLEFYIMEQCLTADWFAPQFQDGTSLRDDGKAFLVDTIPGNHPTTDPSTYGMPPTNGNWSPFPDPTSQTPDGGIVDTYEDPCCCKLLADVEWIGNNFGILTP